MKVLLVSHSTALYGAQRSLVEVCNQLGMSFTEEPGEAAFYGPKADFVVTDCIGREWQLGYDKLPPLPWWRRSSTIPCPRTDP